MINITKFQIRPTEPVQSTEHTFFELAHYAEHVHPTTLTETNKNPSILPFTKHLIH